MDSLVDAYINTLIWTSIDDGGMPLDKNYGIINISQHDRDIIKLDIIKFELLIQNSILESFENITDLTSNDYNKIIEDFVLTRNGHGCGFWDGDYDLEINNINIGDKLTSFAKSFSTMTLFIGDDNQLYIY